MRSRVEMLDPTAGPYLFDTSAEGWFARSNDPAAQRWLASYLAQNPIHVSSLTVYERIRGYGILWRNAKGPQRAGIERSRQAYLRGLGRVRQMDAAVATIAAEISALLPAPPTPPKRAHRMAETKQERLSRWRVDAMIAATALATDMLLLHNNAVDFETIRSAIERDPERFPGLGPLQLVRCAAAI